jgi:hypothetical protein
MNELIINIFGPIIIAVALGVFLKLTLDYLNKEGSYGEIEFGFLGTKFKLGKNPHKKLINGEISLDKDNSNNLSDFIDDKINKAITVSENKINSLISGDNENKLFRYSQVIENTKDIRERIKKEINNLSRRANLNLAIGIFAAMIAIVFLLYNGWFRESDFHEKWFNFLTFYLPKLSLLLFLGTFSFYFLNLYKSNLGVIQYYQNELNDIDFKIIALTTILLSENNTKSLEKISDYFAKMNWNKIMSKEQTNIELERRRYDQDIDKEYINKIWGLKEFFNQKEENKDEVSSEQKEQNPKDGEFKILNGIKSSIDKELNK